MFVSGTATPTLNEKSERTSRARFSQILFNTIIIQIYKDLLLVALIYG